MKITNFDCERNPCSSYFDITMYGEDGLKLSFSKQKDVWQLCIKPGIFIYFTKSDINEGDSIRLSKDGTLVGIIDISDSDQTMIDKVGKLVDKIEDL